MNRHSDERSYVTSEGPTECLCVSKCPLAQLVLVSLANCTYIKKPPLGGSAVKNITFSSGGHRSKLHCLTKLGCF